VTSLARPRPSGARLAPSFGVVAGALPVAFAAVLLSQTVAPSLPSAVAGGLALVALVLVAVARYEAVVAAGVLLLGAVWTEPAPSDAVFALAIVVALATGRFRLSAVPRTVRHLLGLFAALNVLSGINAVDLHRGARFLTITIYLIVLGIWLAGFVDSRRRVRLVVGGYLVAALTSALLGTAALFVSFPGSGMLSGDGFRARGLFEDPNVFGPFLVPAALIVLEERLRPSLFNRRPVLGSLCLFVLAGGVLFSYSRAAWLNLVIGVLVITVLRGRTGQGARQIMRVAVLGVIASVAAVVAIQPPGRAPSFAERAHYQGYDADRFGAQHAGVELALAHPLGVGPGQVDALLPVSTHSLYVRTLAEQGVLGLTVVLALVCGTLALAARNAWRRYDLHGLSALPLLAAWVRAPRQQRGRRHAPLAPSLAAGGADLGDGD
jgi:O-antigen ligase